MEEWKDIIGYEGLYRISSHGRVLSLYNDIPRVMSHIERIDNSYQSILLFKDKKQKGFRVHRLVAYHFVPNPNNYPIVDHLDRNRQNNHYTNLEWVTYKENSRRWVAMDKAKYDQMQPGVLVQCLGTSHISKIKSRHGVYLTLEDYLPGFPYPVLVKEVTIIQ